MGTNANSQRQPFLPSFLEALKGSAERRSWRAVVPIWIVISLVVGSVVSAFVPDQFWSNQEWEVSTTVYAGMLTFNGLIMALGWAVFSKIYEIICAPNFSSYLKKHDFLNSYITYISYIHIVQICAVIVSAAGLVSVLFEIESVWADRAVLALVVACTMYSIKQASAAITGMHDLIWQKAVFDEGTACEESASGQPERGDSS